MFHRNRGAVDVEALNEASREEVRTRGAAKRAARQAELERQADIRRRREATIEISPAALQDMRNVLEANGVANAQSASAKKIVQAISEHVGLETFLRRRGYLMP